MKIHVLEAGLAAALVARAAWAQPAPEPANPGTPPGDTAIEPTIAPEPVAPTPPPGAEPPVTTDQIVIASTGRIDLNLFGDVSAVQRTDEDLGFAIGPVGFQLAAHLAEGLVGRTEIAMEFEDGETIVDVERAYLEYRTPHWVFSAGRTHSELGYWNNAFHHGRWLQLTIDRPRVLRFEDDGGMLPVHQVGVTAAYGPKRGNAGIELAVGIGNGHGRVLEAIQNVGDNNQAKSVLARLGLVGIGLPGLRVGVNFGFDVIAPEPATVRPLAPDAEILELITGAYLALRSDRLIVYAEGYNVVHRAMGTTWQVTDGFVLAGFRVGKFIPYGQFEARHGDGATDPYFNPDPAINSASVAPIDYTEGIGGVHYDLNSWSALKVEVSARRQSGADDYRAELNWSFGR